MKTTQLLLGLVVALVLASPVSAQVLTAGQRTTLRAAILADPGSAPYLTPGASQEGDLQGLADYMNGNAAPDFWIWRTVVSRSDVYNTVDWEGGTWNWTTYKAQSATEQNAWVQMFMGDQADFSKDNVRAGVAAIFTGSAQANAQRDHCLSVGREKGSRFEKVFAVGTGSPASPAKPGADANGQPIQGNVAFSVFVGL